MLAESEAVLNIAVAPDLVVEYVYPLQSNQSVIGLDLRQRPDFARGVNRAIEQKATILDGPFDLVQGGQGFILRSPVLVTQNSAEARRVWGMISLVIDKNMLFTSAGFFENSPNLELAVHNHQGDLLFGAPDLRDKDPITAPVQLYGVDWVVSVAPPDGWAQSQPKYDTSLGCCGVFHSLGAACDARIQLGIFAPTTRRNPTDGSHRST